MANEISERAGDGRIHRKVIHRRIKGPAKHRATQRHSLPMAGKAVIHAMVHGPFNDVTIDIDGPAPRKTIRAFEPMDFVDACRVLGLDPRQILDLTWRRKFGEEMQRQLNSRRCMEQARNLGVAIAIRDSQGDGTPLATNNRLKAVMMIERSYAQANPQPSPQVQITNIQQSGLANAAKPGYVIKLATPKTIEHEP